MNEPTPNGESNGRDSRGKFVKGNPGGPGNPNAALASRHRAAFWRAIRNDDVAKALAVIRAALEDKDARMSDRLAAARELLDRIIGRPVQADLTERLERLEATLSAMEASRERNEHARETDRRD
jgi:hypothetical protein